jgi:putative oxidoreductase
MANALNRLNQYRDEAQALLRIVAGFMFMLHGAQKILGLMSEMPRPAIGTLMWVAGLIELLGGLAVMLGAYTRIAAFICSGEMAVAYVTAHWKGHLNARFFPTVNHGELALLYCFVFLFIAAAGSGKWSLDKRL